MSVDNRLARRILDLVRCAGLGSLPTPVRDSIAGHFLASPSARVFSQSFRSRSSSFHAFGFLFSAAKSALAACKNPRADNAQLRYRALPAWTAAAHSQSVGAMHVHAAWAGRWEWVSRTSCR